jgi:hypothetical protein
MTAKIIEGAEAVASSGFGALVVSRTIAGG